MKECWSEGELRAYIDGELTAAEMERVKLHLETCSGCGDAWAGLAGRAQRVSALMGSLAEARPGVAVMPVRKRRAVWRWAGAAAALAAGLLAGIRLLPKHPQPEVAIAPTPQPAVQSASTVLPPVLTPEPVATVERARPVKAVAARRQRPLAAAAVPGGGPFLALDDEPIDSGVVWRVELGPRAVPADVIVGADGRPRAIRLVNSKAGTNSKASY